MLPTLSRPSGFGEADVRTLKVSGLARLYARGLLDRSVGPRQRACCYLAAARKRNEADWERRLHLASAMDWEVSGRYMLQKGVHGFDATST